MSIFKGENGVLNALNLANAGVAAGLGIYNASQINRLKEPAKIVAPELTPTLVRDRTASTMAAARDNIRTSGNTTREALMRSGRTEHIAGVTSAEMRAGNELASSVEQARNNIEATNVGILNRFKEINSSNNLNVSKMNSDIKNSFMQYKSGLLSQSLTSTVDNVMGNVAGVAQNEYRDSMVKKKEIQDLRDQIDAIDLASATGSANDAGYLKSMSIKLNDRLNKLLEQ